MPMTSHWSAIAPSQFPWEREALDWLREHLPNAEPLARLVQLRVHR